MDFGRVDQVLVQALAQIHDVRLESGSLMTLDERRSTFLGHARPCVHADGLVRQPASDPPV
jgi:hypothetical protein